VAGTIYTRNTEKMRTRNQTDKTSILNRKSKIANLKSQDGYVLVVIIGILTILSLMTITFATLSRIETRATRNYTDSIKCEKIAKAALEHAIYEIWLDKFGTDTLAYNDPDDGNPGQYGLDENFDASGTSWPGNSTFPGTDFDNDNNDGDNDDSTGGDSAWIYFPAVDQNSDIRLPGDLRARYAVLITDDREARVNVNVSGNDANAGSHTSNEGWSTFEIDLSNIIEEASTGNGDTTAASIIDTRLGSDDAPGTSTANDDTGIVPDPQSDIIDNDGDWTTGNDTNGNGIPDFGETGVDDGDNSESIDEPNEFNSIFPYSDDVPFGLLSEAEIMGTSSYTSRLEEIFNSSITENEQNSLNSWVTTCSADTILCPSYQLDGGTSTTRLNINALVYNEGAYTDKDIYNTNKKVQMLVDALTAGGVPDVERQQMAVNIVDFIDGPPIDPDSVGTVTAYNDGSNTYYGIEKTPYINEVEADTTSGNGKFIELFNPYDTIIDLSSWKITGTTMPEIPLSGSIGSQTYYVISDSNTEYVTNFNYNSGADADLYDTNVNNLTSSGETLTLSDADGNPVQVTNYGNELGNTRNTMQLNDPRPIPLTASASNPWEWTRGDETAGEENLASIFDPGDGDDGWSDTTWTPSFLVSNRRFTNTGYLGFIHKGKEWTSVRVGDTAGYRIATNGYPNLLSYITITDPSMDSIDNDGDSSTDSADTGSQSGDFDGQEHRIPGLINVNTASTEVLASLPNGSGGTLGSTIAASIYGGSKPYSSIGDFIDKVDGANGITDASATNKWDEEKRLRAISNLITTRSNVFTVYVTAQITNEGQSEVFAEKRILAIVDRSIDPIKVRYFRWLVE